MKRKCIHCSHFIREKDGRRRPGYIGRCGQYDRLVLDALCGCRNEKDGSVVLMNFEMEGS